MNTFNTLNATIQKVLLKTFIILILSCINNANSQQPIFADQAEEQFVTSVYNMRLNVVKIMKEEKGKLEFVCTGFILTSNGFIATEGVAVKANNFLKVGVFDEKAEGYKYYPASKIKIDTTYDIAVLKISKDNLNPVKLGNSDQFIQGHRVATLGFPFGTFSVTQGIIASLSITPGPNPKSKWLDEYYVDITTNEGNSGSPLFRPNTGDVIGVITGAIDPLEGNNIITVGGKSVLHYTTGIAIAIKINDCKRIFKNAGVPIK